MNKLLTVVVTAFAVAAAGLFGAGAATAAPTAPAACDAAYDGFVIPVAFYSAGQKDTCTTTGWTNRALPIVSATLYPLGSLAPSVTRGVAVQKALALPGSGMRGTRIGTGTFTAAGVARFAITIPKKTADGSYVVIFQNLFDSSQTTGELACVGALDNCDFGFLPVGGEQ